MSQENKKTPIVFDTNTFISAALLPNSQSKKALYLALERYQPVISSAIFDELEEVIYRPHLDKYFSAGNNRNDFLSFIARTHIFTHPETIVTDCSDPDDNMILELAVETQSRYIVSGDAHLLTMNPFRGILILRPHEFIEAESSQ